MEDLKRSAVNYLQNENNYVSAFLAKVESRTKMPREQIAAVFGGLFSIYLVVGYFAQLVCNFIGFAYPAYASMVAIESNDKSDDTQWLIYWTVYAVFSFLDFAADEICGWFPIYWLAKCIFFIYLYHPSTLGAQKMYVNHVKPILQCCTGIVNNPGAISGATSSLVDAQAQPLPLPPPPAGEGAAQPPSF